MLRVRGCAIPAIATQAAITIAAPDPMTAELQGFPLRCGGSDVGWVERYWIGGRGEGRAECLIDPATPAGRIAADGVASGSLKHVQVVGGVSSWITGVELLEESKWGTEPLEHEWTAREEREDGERKRVCLGE